MLCCDVREGGINCLCAAGRLQRPIALKALHKVSDHATEDDDVIDGLEKRGGGPNDHPAGSIFAALSLALGCLQRSHCIALHCQLAFMQWCNARPFSSGCTPGVRLLCDELSDSLSPCSGRLLCDELTVRLTVVPFFVERNDVTEGGIEEWVVCR